MEFISRRPAAPLDTWIESIWLCRAGERSGAERRSSQPRALERVLPSGTAQLIVNLAEDETRVYDESASGLVCQRSPVEVFVTWTIACSTGMLSPPTTRPSTAPPVTPWAASGPARDRNASAIHPAARLEASFGQ